MTRKDELILADNMRVLAEYLRDQAEVRRRAKRKPPPARVPAYLKKFHADQIASIPIFVTLARNCETIARRIEKAKLT
jgi:hypothetical protein